MKMQTDELYIRTDNDHTELFIRLFVSSKLLWQTRDQAYEAYITCYIMVAWVASKIALSRMLRGKTFDLLNILIEYERSQHYFINLAIARIDNEAENQEALSNQLQIYAC